jgi:hypothetical protein
LPRPSPWTSPRPEAPEWGQNALRGPTPPAGHDVLRTGFPGIWWMRRAAEDGNAEMASDGKPSLEHTCNISRGPVHSFRWSLSCLRGNLAHQRQNTASWGTARQAPRGKEHGRGKEQRQKLLRRAARFPNLPRRPKGQFNQALGHQLCPLAKLKIQLAMSDQGTAKDP